MGSGGGSDGGVVAFNIRDPQFKFDHRKILSTICTIKNRKDENKEKEARNGPSLKKPLQATTLPYNPGTCISAPTIFLLSS